MCCDTLFQSCEALREKADWPEVLSLLGIKQSRLTVQSGGGAMLGNIFKNKRQPTVCNHVFPPKYVVFLTQLTHDIIFVSSRF